MSKFSAGVLLTEVDFMDIYCMVAADSLKQSRERDVMEPHTFSRVTAIIFTVLKTVFSAACLYCTAATVNSGVPLPFDSTRTAPWLVATIAFIGAVMCHLLDKKWRGEVVYYDTLWSYNQLRIALAGSVAELARQHAISLQECDDGEEALQYWRDEVEKTTQRVGISIADFDRLLGMGMPALVEQLTILQGLLARTRQQQRLAQETLRDICDSSRADIAAANELANAIHCDRAEAEAQLQKLQDAQTRLESLIQDAPQNISTLHPKR